MQTLAEQIEWVGEVREWLDEPSHWWQGAYHSPEYRAPVSALTLREVLKDAPNTCLVGAFVKYGDNEDFYGDIPGLYDIFEDSPITFNDTHTYTEVVGKLDELLVHLKSLA